MMQGIDDTFDAAIFLGYHASTTNRLDGPVSLEIRFKNYRPAELLSYLPNVDRVDSHTVSFVGRDMVEISRFIEFATGYSPSLAP